MAMPTGQPSSSFRVRAKMQVSQESRGAPARHQDGSCHAAALSNVAPQLKTLASSLSQRRNISPGGEPGQQFQLLEPVPAHSSEEWHRSTGSSLKHPGETKRGFQRDSFGRVLPSIVGSDQRFLFLEIPV